MKRVIFLLILFFSVFRALPVFAGNVSIQTSGTLTDNYTMTFTNAYGTQEVSIQNDLESEEIFLDDGTYEISCEPSANGNMLRVDCNRITVKKDEPLKLSVSETKAGYLYIRPDLMDGFRGTLEIQLKDTVEGSVYYCKINEYNYPYSTWDPMFYWKTMQLPCGSYEVIQCKAQSRGHYLYTTIPEKTIDVYQSWSGMFFPSVSDIEIDKEEAEAVYLDGMDYKTQEPDETAKPADEEQNSRDGKVSLYLFIAEAVVLLALIAVVGIIFLKRKAKSQP